MAEENQLQKKEKKPIRKRNRPDLANFGQEFMGPGDNRTFLRHAMASLQLEPIDISDPEQVWERAIEYLSYCAENDVKANKTGILNWLGIDKTTWSSWARGAFRRDTHMALAKKINGVLEEFNVQILMNAKANPANMIFLLKNDYGWKDQLDIAPVIAQPLGDMPDPKALAAKVEGITEEDA